MRKRHILHILIPALAISMALCPIGVRAQGLREAVRDHQQAVKLSEQGRYEEAEPLYKRSLAIREKVQGPNNPEVATALNYLAVLYKDQGRYGEAELLHKRALAIREKAYGSNHVDVAASLNNLAVVYRAQGRLAEAQTAYKRALAIWEKVFGRDDPEGATLLNNLAEIERAQGRYEEAERLYKRSLAVKEKALGPSHRDLAIPLNNLGEVYVSQGRYDEAEPLYRRSLVIREKALGPDHPAVALAVNNLAVLYAFQGRAKESESLQKRSLAIFEKVLGPDHPNVAMLLNNLAEGYTAENRHAAAEPLYKRSLAVFEKSLGPDHPDVALSLNNLAGLYAKESRYAESEPLFERALAIREKAFGPDHPHVALTLNNLAGLYRDQGRYQDALPLVRRTVDRRKAAPYPTLDILLGARRANLIADTQSFADSYKVLQYTSSSAVAEAVNRLSQRFAAGSGRLAELVRKDQDLTAEGKRLEKDLIAAVSRAPQERDQASEERMRQRLAEIGSEREKISKVLSEHFPDYVSLTNPEPLTLAETQALLATDEAVVAFYISDPKSYAWVVTSSAADWTEIPARARTLTEEIQKLRQSLTFTQHQPFDAVLSHAIHEQTFGPIAPKLAGKTRLSVITNGALTSVPLGILTTAHPNSKALKDTDWLIRSYAITILPSIYSLKTMRAEPEASGAAKPMISFADPVFAKKARAKAKAEKIAMRSLPSFYRGAGLDVKSLAESLPQLPGTRVEVETIAKNLQVEKDDVKFGLDATEKAIKGAKLDGYRIVYLATHGLVAGEMRQFSKAKAEPALAFTTPDKPSPLDDGILEASEVATLRLNADWVVLSACNTASSDGVGAEPLSGLARAFLYAGGKSLVVSHWDVSDEATAKLMIDLFEISKDEPNLSHGEALRRATLNLLDASTSEAEAHPRVWAPFVVVGEPAKPRDSRH